ncbi:MAG: HAD-IA family hydrolase [Lentisphaeria bacterium]|nr:HAD-IA family hydrolase [Lentisphaeria bacterium]
MAKIVVSDLDGTLIDSLEDIAGSVNRMRESFGLSAFPVAEITGMVGDGAVILVERALRGTGVDVEEGVKRMRRFYADFPVEKTVLYPGVAEGLEKMRSCGIKLAVVTNKPTPHARLILRTLKVDHLFDEIWGGDSGFPLKPDPAALLAFRDRYDAPLEQCWMLGDHYTDLGAGRLAGFRRGWAAWGFGDPRDEEYDHKFDTFAGFTEIVTE